MQYKFGTPFKEDRKLSNGSGKVEFITIHNIDRIKVNANTSMAEYYIGSTWPNANMGGFRVHYYIDETECWQQLQEDEVGCHIEKINQIGNETSIAIAIIMDEYKNIENSTAEKRGALLSAILLHKHNLPIERLVPHKKWNNDKYCPSYILPHWDEFIKTVNYYLDQVSK